ncbi:MAG: glycosyl hydrolase [Gemmatimonadota bacterium]
MSRSRPRPLSRIFLHAATVGATVFVLAGVGAPLSAQQSLLFADSIVGVDFREVGPSFRSGRVGDIAMDPRSRGTWYVASASGGLWKTTNGGVDWTPIFDDQGSYSIGTVVLDPENPDVVWVGTGENNSQRSVSFGDGVYKSTDGGETWRNTGLGASEHIGKIVIDPRDSDIVYVAAQGPLWRDGGDRGLYRTTDGGETWERILHVSEMTGISDVVQDPDEPDVLYAASYQRRRHTGVLIAGGPEGTIFKSEDGGDTWREIDQGLPGVDRGRIGLALSPQRPDVVYAVVAAANDSSGFYRSEDRGESWMRVNDWAPNDPQYYQELFPNPHREGEVWGVEVQLMRTTDHGDTWEPWPTQGVHVDHHAMAFNPNDPEHILLGNDGGLYESQDAGRTWRYFDNLPLMQFYRVGADESRPFYRIGGGTQDNGTVIGLQQTRNQAGVLNPHWGPVTGGDGFDVEFDHFDPDIVYTESQNGAVRRTNYRTDEQVGIRPDDPEGVDSRWYWDTPIVASRHVPGRFYMASERVWRSHDRGDTWSAISEDLTKQIDRDTLEVMGRVWPDDAVWKHVYTADLGTIVSLDESRIDPNLLVAGTDDGLVQITDDGGRTWRRIDRVDGVPETGYVADVVASRHHPDRIYAVFNNHKRGDFLPYLARSDDRGATWRVITDGMDEWGPLWSLAEDDTDPELLFVGAEFGVYVSGDGGARWTRLDGGLPVIQVRELMLQDREDDLLLGTFGRGFWIMDDISFLREAGEVTASTTAHLFQPPNGESYEFDIGVYRSYARQDWSASNPPYGVPLTFWLAEDEVGEDLAVLVREAGSGEEVHRIDLEDAAAGLRRVTWGLTRTEEVPEQGGGGGGGGDDDTREVPVQQGSFEAAVVRVTGDGAASALSEWRSFSVSPLPEAGG